MLPLPSWRGSSSVRKISRMIYSRNEQDQYDMSILKENNLLDFWFEK